MLAENISKLANADFITNVLRLQRSAEAKLHTKRMNVTATVKKATKLIVQAAELNLSSEVVKCFVKENENLESSNGIALLMPDAPFLSVVGTEFNTNSTTQLNVTFNYQLSVENLKRLLNSISSTSPKRVVMLNPKCSLLDVNATRFSNTGCQYIPPDQGTNVTCSCNHTTLFAVLLTVRTSEAPSESRYGGIYSFTACIRILCFPNMKQIIMLPRNKRDMHKQHASVYTIRVKQCNTTGVPRNVRVPQMAAGGSAETDRNCLGRNSQPQFHAVEASPLFHSCTGFHEPRKLLWKVPLQYKG